MANVKEVSVESGMSVEVQPNIWHKFRFAMTLEIEDGDDMEVVKRKAWNTCHNEVEKQVREVFDL